MTARFEVAPLTSAGGAIERLIAEAGTQGFPFMETLRREWLDGRNRFDKAGEIYLGVYSQSALLAAGGLNHDPYCSQARTGRIRHVYVLESARRLGAGRYLLGRLVEHARPHFDRLRLRTRTEQGAAFYEAFGFSRSDEDAATHVLEL